VISENSIELTLTLKFNDRKRFIFNQGQLALLVLHEIKFNLKKDLILCDESMLLINSNYYKFTGNILFTYIKAETHNHSWEDHFEDMPVSLYTILTKTIHLIHQNCASNKKCQNSRLFKGFFISKLT